MLQGEGSEAPRNVGLTEFLREERQCVLAGVLVRPRAEIVRTVEKVECAARTLIAVKDVLSC